MYFVEIILNPKPYRPELPCIWLLRNEAPPQVPNVLLRHNVFATNALQLSHVEGFRVWEVWDLGFRVWEVWDLGFRVLEVWGVWGLGFGKFGI